MTKGVLEGGQISFRNHHQNLQNHCFGSVILSCRVSTDLVFLLLGLYFCNSLYFCPCLGCLVLVPPRQSEHHAKPGLRAGSGNQGDFSLSQNCPFRHHPRRKDIFKAGFCALPVHSVQLFHMDFPLQLHLNWPKPDFKYLPNLHHPIYIIYI